MNAELYYSLYGPSSDLFSIDPHSGAIFSSSDIHDNDDSTLHVHVEDAGETPKFDITTVSVRFQNSSDFPRLNVEIVHFSLSEDEPVGTLVAVISAASSRFWVNSSTGEIYTKQPLRLFNIYQFRVIAFDHGSVPLFSTATVTVRSEPHNLYPPMFLPVKTLLAFVLKGGNSSNFALVHINVINTNDAPIFSSTRYLANISEDSSIGTSVVKVSALDQDSFSDWSRFFFSIASGNTELSFTIDASSGVVSVNSRLDRELCSIYHLTITATDNGSPPATGTTDVIVTIVDVNDNAPMLISTLAEVKENQPQGTIAARLNASDPDSPPNQGPFTYWLINSSGTFSLTSDGVLITTSVLDREQMSAYIVLVGVKFHIFVIINLSKGLIPNFKYLVYFDSCTFKIFKFVNL
uniref:Cadherin domain-containing protein n=1 Tax=Gouania willdenowi TaxID=441366 RepID=A0A8C5EPE0_GOUWI